MLTTYLVPDKHKVQSYKARIAKEQKMKEKPQAVKTESEPAAEEEKTDTDKQ
jgi:hypothetical protein